MGMISKKETKRLILRPLQMRDDRAWAAAHCAMLPTKSGWEIPRQPMNKIGYDEYAKVLAEQKRQSETEERHTLGIFHKETGILLGFLYIENIERGPKSHATLDFRLFNIYWKKGFAKEALAEGLKMKKQLKLESIELSKEAAKKQNL